MARSVEERIRCDYPGCRKAVAHSTDHISVSLAHRVASNDVPETVTASLAASGDFDFCSWDHALSFLAKRGKEAVARREEIVTDAHEAARVQAEQEAQAERQAKEAAADAEREAARADAESVEEPEAAASG